MKHPLSTADLKGWAKFNKRYCLGPIKIKNQKREK